MGVARRRHGAHVAPVRAALVILGVLVGIAVLAAAWFIRAPLPKVDGTLDVAGLRSDVTIRRDDRGIPHIEAASTSDLFFGQGFACAQDRLWQMDILRREAEGKLSEVFGPIALSVDEYYRTIGLGEAAQAAVDRAPPSEREVLRSYAAGVNAAASTRPLPLEFRLLGYSPKPWTPADTLAVGLLITKQQDDGWKDTLLRSDLAAKVGVPAAQALMDFQLPSLEEYMPGYASHTTSPATHTSAIAEPAPDLADGYGVVSPSLAEHQGSNNWTVAGSRTTTGKPVLSNDTHLDHTLPSTWWISQIEGGGYDVEGFTLPGVPGVIIGHNRDIAFGVTSAAEDVEDLFIEKFESSRSDRYLANGKWVAAQHRIERIDVKGKPALVLDVLVTRHGPVVKRAGATALALSWTILREGSGITAVLDWDRAADWPQFRAALSELVGPTLNFAYADVDGHIGYQDAGRVPARAAGDDGSLPVEGQDDRFAWKGDVPFDTLPHALDPRRGFLATANNEVVPASFAPPLSRDYLPPYRIHQIVALLSLPGSRTPESIGAIQGDDFDYPRSRLASVAAPILAASTSSADRDLGALLSSWNGDAGVDDTAPTFVAALDRALQDRLLRKRIGSALLARYDDHEHLLTAVVRALDGDDSLANVGITRASVLAAILPAAHDAETALKYPQRPLQKWGDANAAVYDHPLAVGWPLTYLSAPTIPQRGDPYTVFQSRPDFGPSMRFVGDTSDWDGSSMLLTLGESGVWTDSHYDDMERAWAGVAFEPTAFSDAAVAKAATDTLHLEPASP